MLDGGNLLQSRSTPKHLRGMSEAEQRIADPSEVADERTTTSFGLDQEQHHGVLAALLHKFWKDHYFCCVCAELVCSSWLIK